MSKKNEGRKKPINPFMNPDIKLNLAGFVTAGITTKQNKKANNV